MSTNSECEIIEYAPNKWYYILEDYDAPKNSWDWMEHAEAYGPFSSEDAACKHLSENHANPGGYGISAFSPERKWKDTIEKLVKNARSGAKRDTFRSLRW